MKIIAVGDVHGRDIWKKVLKKEPEFDKFVFIGDYFDSFTISPEKQQDNFQEILEFKKEFPDKVILLIGNHDMHYLPNSTQNCSGHNPANQLRIGTQLGQLVDEGIMQVCWQYENVMFSHAGISKTWLNSTGIFDADLLTGEEDEDRQVAPFINELFLNRIDLFEFNKIDTSGFGEHIAQSPLWIRPESLKTDVGAGITQVIGHTTFGNIFAITPEPEELEEGTQPIILIDSPKSGEYLYIDGAEIKIREAWQKRKGNTG